MATSAPERVNSLYFEDNIDTTVNPADDFSYANGKWLRNNAILKMRVRGVLGIL